MKFRQLQILNTVSDIMSVCLTLYIVSEWKSLQPQSSENWAAVPLALFIVPREDPSQEMKIKADPTSENEIIPCWRRAL